MSGQGLVQVGGLLKASELVMNLNLDYTSSKKVFGRLHVL